MSINKAFQAYDERNLTLLGATYNDALHALVEYEREYNRKLLSRLDFQSRTALDKQEKAILQENPELLELSEKIAEAKATLRACSFVLDLLKLQARTSKGVEI